ncbi:DsrE family protein [Ectothiorhodospiraceae bacterium 2226]|nr:DsrE family protein [Ectothiorhodospiraceae bacterium 2226]
MKTLHAWLVLLVLSLAAAELGAAQPPQEPALPFVVQLTRTTSDFGHRRVMLQLDKVLDDLGDHAVNFTVVAYEEGIHALLADNEQTAQLVTKLAHRGVVFKACRISMRAWQLSEDDFPLEVEFIDAGAPEVVRLQMIGYRYWRP